MVVLTNELHEMMHLLQITHFLWRCAILHIKNNILFYYVSFHNTRYFYIPNTVQLPRTLKLNHLQLELFHPLIVVSMLGAQSTNKLHLVNALVDQRQKTIYHSMNLLIDKLNTENILYKVFFILFPFLMDIYLFIIKPYRYFDGVIK